MTDAETYAYRYQIISGYADGQFKPEQSITRAEAIKMINRMLYRGPLTGVFSSYPDNADSSWYFEDIEEACVSNSYTLDKSGKETLLKLAEEPLW